MMCMVRGSRSSATGTYPLRTCASTGVKAVIARLIVDWDTPNASPNSACTRLRRR